ncbi:MAG: hypothetical protein DLM66_12340 [Candidatus Dormiibacter spiritus]|nr:MAG: hypothetical protein DLM66_12340 [Candidatus Dormibacteraeota bacterium]
MHCSAGYRAHRACAPVLVSALLSRAGSSGRLIALWSGGAFELVVSEALLAELDRTLAHPKLRQHIDPKDAADFRQLVRSTASMFAGASRSPLQRSRR